MVNRRGFSATHTSGSAGAVAPQSFTLERNGWVPNNPRLPVLLYKGAVRIVGDDPASLFEAIFRRNGWPPQWRNGVYNFHQLPFDRAGDLGICRRSRARLMLGGPNGREVSVEAGDLAVLPVGTGHCLIEGSDDFLVVGAYPPDQHFDICRQAPTHEASERMSRLSYPLTDPVSGNGGFLAKIWTAT